MDAVTLKAINLSCVRQQRPILHHLCFHLTAGNVLLVEGANGAGKSSLLRLLAGLASPASGELHWCDQPISFLRTDYWSKLHYISHHNGIKLGLTVAENLRLIQHITQSPSCDLRPVLTALQLNAYQHIPAHYLSAGQKRRLALAKLFLFSKPLWLLDEPLTALDAQTQAFFLMQLEQHLQRGGMAVISSHHTMPINASVQTLRLSAC